MKYLRQFRLVTLRTKIAGSWSYARDPQVPLRIKLAALALLLLILSPLNVLGDLPFFGLLDDVALISILLGWFIKTAEPHARVGAGSALELA